MSDSKPLSNDSFGSSPPSPLARACIRLAQTMPPNKAGFHVANLMRSWVTRFASVPMDVQAEDLRLRCFFRDNYSEKKFVFTPWRFDAQERRYIRDNLPADGVFLDIGANVGIYSLTALKALDTRGTLVSIEPNPAVHKRLVFNLNANMDANPNQAPTLHTVQAGISDRNHTLELHINHSNLGQSSVNEHGRSRHQATQSNAGDTESIPCRPLLELLEELSIQRVDGLKIDIEGAEDRALVPYLEDSPEHLLARFILIENSEDAWDLPLLATMQQRGYQRVQQFSMNSLYRLESAEGSGHPEEAPGAP
ncbi:FkbM family methyltransferase [Halospina denitrificans]|uniref:FkbM family methyltransferase n=1 Tax=Halospina denitrificans TaxID=332522 RepID=A0A4R7K1V3_9GAMM|nr:FkbM family methyltransferase [Halospina denitrificans]TDT44344.1 FkbM family methyltransferase [Halospina denitrificans]